MACAVGVSCVPLGLAGPAAASWTPQGSATSSNLYGVDCPTELSCYAVGAGGTVRATRDGGRTGWAGQSSGTGNQLGGVSCPSANQCWAVGGSASPASTIRATVNAGESWSAQSSGVPWQLATVSCPSASTCWAGGLSGVVSSTLTAGLTSWAPQPGAAGWTVEHLSCPVAGMCFAALAGPNETGGVLRTQNGGQSWTLVKSGITGMYGIDCATPAHCVAVGKQGQVVASSDGGSTWQTGNAGVGTTQLLSVSCATTDQCTAVGFNGVIINTTDRGHTWTRESSGVTATLNGVACPDAADCWAVGDGGTILSNSATGAAGSCSEGKVGVPPACIAPSGRGAPSNDCVGPSSAVAIDGYVGSMYARLRSSQLGSQSLVCTRLQPEGGTEYAGGKLVAGNSGAPLTPDANYGACAAQSGNTRFVAGEFGDPSDPTTHLPFSLDVWRGDAAAWVCLRAGLGARVVYNAPASFEQDDPAAATAPLRTPWTPGVDSADCEAQVTGTKTRLVNADFGDGHVWATGWQQGNKVMLCVRAARGSTAEGARISIDASGLPGVNVIREIASDATGCTLNVFSLESPQLAVRRSGPNDNPASVCVTLGSTTVRLTLGFTGTVPNGAIDVKADR